MGDLRTYVEERHQASTKGLPRGRGAALLRRVSSPRLREMAKLRGTLAAMPLSRLKVRTLLRQHDDVRLNLGSGRAKINGWINVDIVGMGPDVHWDLRRGVPFPDGSVDAVFLEHVLEHFSLSDVLDVLDECRRVLRPNGMIRVGVPDFGRYIESYAGDRHFIEENRPGRPTPLIAVGEVALAHGHRSVWDAITLEGMLAEAGFVEVSVRAFGDSQLEPPPDTPMREPETLYAEGRKPDAQATSATAD